jgi:hypothetical protein
MPAKAGIQTCGNIWDLLLLQNPERRLTSMPMGIARPVVHGLNDRAGGHPPALSFGLLDAAQAAVTQSRRNWTRRRTPNPVPPLAR